MTTVAIIGCGALGLNYGTRLLEAQIYHNEDLDVSLVLRRDFDLVQAEGIAVEYGKATESKRRLEFSAVQLTGQIFRSTSELAYSKGRMDWVIVCCKSYSIDDALRDSLIPLVGDTTKVLVIMNGLGVEKCFIDWFGTERVYGGLSLIACNRGPNPPLSPGPLVVNVYLDLKLEISHVTDNVEKTKLAIDLFKRTALRDTVSLSTNLLRARWDKLTWNLTYAGISVAMGGLTCDVIVRDPSLRLLANNVICDTIRVANADIRRQHQERHGEGGEVPAADLLSQETILAEIWVRTENAGAYKSSTVLDLVAGNPLEMRYLFGVPLERARDLQRQDASLHFAHLESVLLMVEGVSRMGARKAALGLPWQPTYFTDVVESTDDGEEEEAPKWMRYMPKSSLFAAAQPLNIVPANDVASVDAGQGTRRKVLVRRSSNAFGPTSAHAMTIETRLRSDKRKRLQEDDSAMVKMVTNATLPAGAQEDSSSATEQQGRRKVRCRGTNAVPNMLEAAELFSIVKLK